MFGKLIGEIIAAPIRVASAAVKVTEVAVETVFDGDSSVPERNALDDAADNISETIEDTLED